MNVAALFSRSKEKRYHENAPISFGFTLFAVLLLASCRQADSDPCLETGQDRIPEECFISDLDAKDREANITDTSRMRYVFNELNESFLRAANRTLPVVAIHLSDRSREEWRYDQKFYVKGIEYFEAYTALEEILNSHKIPFVELSDAEIESGQLMTDSSTVRYPILFSLNNEVVSKEAVEQIRRYVSSSGTVFFSYNSFTRLAEEPGPRAPKDCFVFDELGLYCMHESNTIYSDTLEKQRDHYIVRHIPTGELAWRMSLYRTTPFHSFLVGSRREDTVLALGKILERKWSFRNILEGVSGIITYKYNETQTVNTALVPLGNGSFIYNSQVNLFWGRYQGEPAIPGAVMALESIRWAFNRTLTPLVEIRPWGEYDAAFMQRFDVEVEYPVFAEIFTKVLAVLDRYSARGVFYIVADQGRRGAYEDGFEFVKITDAPVSMLIQNAQRLGHVIGSHSTWHVGPDFESQGEAIFNINNSLDMFEQVLGSRPDEWVAPAFGANFDSSLQILEMLGIKTTGDQKIGYLPHFALSPEKEGHHYDVLQVPTSDYFHSAFENKTALATILEHHNSESVAALVDYYIEIGGIINLYSHFKAGNDMRLGHLLDLVSQRDNVWHTTPDELYEYWKKRDGLDFESIEMDSRRMILALSNSNSEKEELVARIHLPWGQDISYVEMKADESSDVQYTGRTVDIKTAIAANSTRSIEIGFAGRRH